MSDEQRPKNPPFIASPELCALTDFMEEQKPGAVLSWDDIQEATGVLMDEDGRRKARAAVVRAGHPPPEPVWGVGLHLAEAAIAVSGARRRSAKTMRAASKAAGYAAECIGQFGTELDPRDYERLMHQSVTLAGIAAMAGEEVKAAKRIEDQRKAAVGRSQTQQQTARNAQIETLRRLAGVQKEKS